MRGFWKRFFVALEASTQKRANEQLRRMGYTPEKLAKMTNENLSRWV